MELIYAAGHCHAPSCLSMELYHADTGMLLCSHYPVYGETHQVRSLVTRAGNEPSSRSFTIMEKTSLLKVNLLRHYATV